MEGEPPKILSSAVAAISRPPELPIDVAEDIIVRLQVRDLVRFKAVSRSWLALISNPRFIKKHLLLHQSSRQTIVAVTKDSHGEDDRYHKIVSLSPDLPDYATPCPSRLELEVVGSYNGLLCLLSSCRFDGRHLYVLNPATRECRTHNIEDTVDINIGFGYDETTNDYKVVMILYSMTAYMVKVWSMSSHEEPREIDSSVLEVVERHHIFFRSGLFIRRKLYWLAYNHERPLVITFDISDETFRLTEVPLPYAALYETALVDFMGSLAYPVTHLARDADHKNFITLVDVWMVDNENIWTKRFTIGPFGSQLAYPIGVHVDGKFLMRKGNKCFLHDDPEEKEIWSNPIYLPNIELWFDKAGHPLWGFSESLASVKADSRKP